MLRRGYFYEHSLYIDCKKMIGDGFMPIKFKKETLKEIHVANVMERLVDEQFPIVMAKYPDACCCRQCLSDIKALTLNNVKPRYVSTDRGDLFERVNISDMLVKVDVLRAMTEAAEKVTNNCRHEPIYED